jgi:hypothetical protein
LVEVTEASEATGIDILLGRPGQSYTANGRVIDADTGKPVPNPVVSVAVLINGQPGGTRRGINGDQNGQFKLEGLTPGMYALFVGGFGDQQINTYSDDKIIEIVDGDISGIEVKAHPGITVIGSVVLDNDADPSAVARLSRMNMVAYPVSVTSGAGTSAYVRFATISRDGSFTITGLRPGKVKLSLNASEGFEMRRIELNEAELVQGVIELTDGPVTGLRVIVGYGTASLRGSVRVVGVDIPPNITFFIQCHRVGSRPGAGNHGALADARGQFLIEGLATGDYEVSARVNYGRTPSPPLRFAESKQIVSIINGVESQITLEVMAHSGNGGAP